MTVLSTANIDGNLTPLTQARIPVADRGFLYGDSIYEVFRTYSGVGFLYEAHWQRLGNSARLIHMEMEYRPEEFFREIRRTILSSGAADLGEDVYVRYAVTRGDGPVELFPTPGLQTRFVIIVKAVPEWDPTFYSEGLVMAIPEVRRNSAYTLDPNIKGGNYLNNVLGVIEARELGADDCLFLNERGLVTEASNSNVFFVVDGRVVTPFQGAGNLIGLTKQTVLRICREVGIEADEAAIEPADTVGASECFVTSTTREVMPVRRLRLEDGQEIEFPSGGGPLTQKIAELYKAYIWQYVEEHQSSRLF